MFSKISKVIYILSFISMIVLMTLLILLNIMPTKYLLIIGIALLIAYLCLGLLTFKVKNKILISFLIVIEIFLSIIFVYASNIVYKTDSFINNIKGSSEEGLYYVVVLKISKYEKLEDLNNKKIGLYSLNDDNYSKILNNIKNKIKFKEEVLNNFSLIKDNLFNGNIDAILISDFNKEMLDSEIEDFNVKTKIIHTEKVVMESTKKENNILSNNETFNVLISGIDTRGNINKISRSDVNIIVTVNPNTNQILLTSIPRDYYVTLHGKNGAKDKLTHASIYGIDTLTSTIEDLLNINIDYYVRVNFDTLVNLVDEIGGIEVYSDTSFTAYNGDKFIKGVNHLDGDKALSYSRERKKFIEGDRKRGSHQQEVITAIINKVTDSRILLSNYSDILNSLNNTFQTSIPTSMIKSYVKKQLNEMNGFSIKSISLNGSDSKGYTYSMPGYLLYVMTPDIKTVENATRLINEMK